MERHTSVTNFLTSAQPSFVRSAVSRICGAFAVRCLKAVVRGYVESAHYDPYWIRAGWQAEQLAQGES
jgi:hypothetical protein